MKLKDKIRMFMLELEETEKYFKKHKDDWQCEICSHLNNKVLGCCEICHSVRDVR